MNSPAKRPLSLILVALYKGLAGCFELLVGLVIVVSSYLVGSIYRAVFIQRTAFFHNLVMQELREDPQDRFVHWLLNFATHTHMSLRHALTIGLFIIGLGIFKIAIGLGIWFRSWTMRNISVVLLSGIVLFAIYELLLHFSFLKFFGLLIEGYILYYVYKVLPRYLPKV